MLSWKAIIVSLLLAIVSIACNPKKDNSVDYFVVVEDLNSKSNSDQYPTAEIIEVEKDTKSDSAAISTALILLHSHLWTGAKLGHTPNKQYDFVMNVFNADGEVIAQESILDYTTINRLIERAVWQRDSSYLPILAYYTSNSNLFQPEFDIIKRGAEYKDKHSLAFDPVNKIKEHQEKLSSSNNEKGSSVHVFLIVIIVLLFFVIIGSKANKSKKDDPNSSLAVTPKLKMLNREGDSYIDEWHTYIAGVKHCVSKNDIGGFCGCVVNDINNKYDNKAMGIYTHGKLLGYIPAAELKAYREWSETDPMPCVGFIYSEGNELRGKVKILRPCNLKFLEVEFSKYLQWVNDNYGKQYLPPTMSMQFEAE